MPFFVVWLFIINEEYQMPRLAQPDVFHPRLQFRYTWFTSHLPGISIYARSAQQPSFDNNPVTVDFMSSYYKLKGKTRWNDITLTCYQFEGITGRELYQYLNNDHFNVSDAVENFADEYKHKMQLFLLNPLGVPTGIWTLEGAFIANASWGSMDYGSDEVMECEITISYDYAEFL